MAVIRLNINGVDRTVQADPETPLLWVLREVLGLTGTKYGCGKGLCGCCTVHMDGVAVRSCSVPVSAVADSQVVTIEGLSEFGTHALQVAWVMEDVPQCGYCQSGQIMTAAALLAKNSSPTEQEIVRAMDGNLCRCGTYLRIKKAIRRAARKTNGTQVYQ